MRRKTGLLAGLVCLLLLAGCAPTTPDQVRPARTESTSHACTSAPASPGVRSGDWTVTQEEHFDRPAARGQVASIYGPCMAGYDGYSDTSGNGRYSPAQVLSVADSHLDWYVHTAAGQPRVAAPAPQGYTGQRYGRWTIRFRSQVTEGYKLAFLLWPDSDRWSDGEINMPEGELGGIIHGYAHNVAGSPAQTPLHVNTDTDMRAWHTAQIAWTPAAVTLSLDGRSWQTHDPAAIPTKPMHWILQVETDLDGQLPDPAVTGHVQVDWLRIEAYTPQP